ncbi:putative superfamily III holin-X [Kribbella sp. VKM Ac-2571]|uniref:phage holin family protein n=1 Tax=Kribbella sp. VKM Ac-2571 TaxID=2512222 RepID=UPI00105D1277|nr:phage holin family protein [Kribbella sp. VKM Ac-2571]TDO69395.1 putative superfamily III holin-X [Kribbella sp. VKM Ac-2571]
MTIEGTPAGSGPHRLSMDESVGELVSQLTTDLGQLTRQELALAKAELQTEAKKAGKGAGMLGGAAVAGWLAALFLSLTVMWALDEAMDLIWAALVVAAIWAIAAAVLAMTGRKELQEVNPKPDQTVESLKEDAKWLKTRKS